METGKIILFASALALGAQAIDPKRAEVHIEQAAPPGAPLQLAHAITISTGALIPGPVTVAG
jgi:hypothetical protein